MKLKTILKHSIMALALAFPLTLPSGGYCDTTGTNYSQPPNGRVGNQREPDADNTARNKRDRRDGTLTPGDQGTTKQDVEITRNIRRAVVSETNSLSIAAKNIKIITVNGKVTLRGPVKNETEKTRIADLAKNIAGEGNVNDQLEVKNNP